MTGKTVAQRVQEAKSRIDNLTPDQVAAELAGGGVTLVDVRDAPELAGGTIAGAVHVSRGMLEFRADPDSPYHDKNFRKDRPVILYCASGGRSALSGKLLKDLGYAEVYNLGAFKDWVDNGGAIDKPIEPGM